MKLVAYLRVSTDRQAEEGLGLDVQEADIRVWANAAGHKITAWYRDEGQSGADGLEARENLALALGAVAGRQAAGIIVWRLDRLARDVILQEQLLREIWSTGGQAFTTSAAEAHYLQDDPGDPSRALIRVILGAVSQYEKAMITLRLKSGRAVKAARGGYAYGAPPFGWLAADRELVPDDAEQAVLDWMRDLWARGTSLEAIAAALNNNGFRSKRGGRWHAMTVSRALARQRSRALA